MRTIKFEYNIGDRVQIKDIKAVGYVDSLCYNVEGIQYRVIYWHGGQRYSVWMSDWEIENPNK